MQVYSSHIFYVRTKPAASYITLKKYGPPWVFQCFLWVILAIYVAPTGRWWSGVWGRKQLKETCDCCWFLPSRSIVIYFYMFFQSLTFTHCRLLRFAVFARRMHSNVPIWGISPAMSNVCVMCVCVRVLVPKKTTMTDHSDHRNDNASHLCETILL